MVKCLTHLHTSSEGSVSPYCMLTLCCTQRLDITSKIPGLGNYLNNYLSAKDAEVPDGA